MGLKVHLVTEDHPLQKTSLVVKASWAPENEGVTGGRALAGPALGAWAGHTSYLQETALGFRGNNSRDPVSAVTPVREQDSSELEGGGLWVLQGPLPVIGAPAT